MGDKKSCLLSVDAGGTGIKAAFFEGAKYVPDTYIRYPIDSYASADKIKAAYQKFASAEAIRSRELGYQISAVSVSMPGPFDYRNGIFRMTHKYASVKDQPAWPWLKEVLGEIPMMFCDDASSVLNGALVLEAMEAYQNICSVNIGTGLGFGARINGEIVLREDGMPGISIWNRPYKNSNIEGYVTRNAIMHYYEDFSGKAG